MNNRLVVLLCTGLSLHAVTGRGQAPSPAAPPPAASPAAALPTFDVASIRPADPNSHNILLNISGGRFLTQNTPVRMLIMFAYDLKSDDQLSGIPGALNSQGFDVDAKPDDAVVPGLQNMAPYDRAYQIRLMLQALLADRFKLKVTRQTKELPVYALVLAKGGLKMKSVPPPAAPPAGAPPPAPTPGNGPRPGMISMSGRGEVSGAAVPIVAIASLLSRQPETGGRVVIDKTGLTGNFDWSLKWTPESDAPMGGPGGGESAPPDSSAPTFFTAIQEQLGLKLESQKAPVEVIVVEHVEEPSAN